MKQVGGWISEGLAIGIAYKAPIAAKEAKNLAKSVKMPLKATFKNRRRDIFNQTAHCRQPIRPANQRHCLW